MKKQVEDWLRRAKIDLLSSKKLLEDDFLTQSVAFHCHQTIEKSLKAILEDKSVKIPRIHDLEKLYGIILELGIRLKIDEDVLAQINDVYIDARYPADTGLIPNGAPSLEKVQEFYGLARTVYEKITSMIEKE